MGDWILFKRVEFYLRELDFILGRWILPWGVGFFFGGWF
jgi:hypothetical protein